MSPDMAKVKPVRNRMVVDSAWLTCPGVGAGFEPTPEHLEIEQKAA